MFGLKKSRDAAAAPEQTQVLSAMPRGTQYGGFWIRSLALAVDSTILFLASAVIAIAFSMLDAGLAMIGGIVCVLLQLLYWPLMHASARQATVGKQMLGLKVMRAGTGERISIPRALARDVVGKIISSLVLGLGYLIAAFTARKQGLHDYVAATVVLREGEAHVARAFVVSLAGILIPAIVIPVFFAGMLAGIMGGMFGGMMGDAVKPPAVQTPAQRTQAKPPAAQSAPASASAPLPALAAGDPEMVYSELHGAIIRGDVAAMRRHTTGSKDAELASIPKDQIAKGVDLSGGKIPWIYKISSKSIAPDGKSATLLAVGALPGNKQEMYGTLSFVRDGGAWKLEAWNWTPEKPAAGTVSQAAKSGTAPVAPAAQKTEDAAADIERLYAKLHAATLRGDVAEMRSHATAAKRAELSAMPKEQITAVVNLMGSLMPQTYKVSRKSITPDGKKANLLAVGISEFGKQEVHGTVNFMLEDSEWKVADWSWTSDKAGGARARAAAPAAAAAKAAAPAGAAAGASDASAAAQAAPDKPAAPVMTAAERKRAREEAAALAEQKRLAQEKLRTEQFNARCSFKPVMTDAEIEQCRPARR